MLPRYLNFLCAGLALVGSVVLISADHTAAFGQEAKDTALVEEARKSLTPLPKCWLLALSFSFAVVTAHWQCWRKTVTAPTSIETLRTLSACSRRLRTITTPPGDFQATARAEFDASGIS